ncbi:MAG: hypothetical protein JWO51_170 [Rhodospirillales bacterium]|nr:hypothetical protein [Rhodospirillales bacterium]
MTSEKRQPAAETVEPFEIKPEPVTATPIRLGQHHAPAGVQPVYRIRFGR